jgi:predicted RNase H-like nuclease
MAEVGQYGRGRVLKVARSYAEFGLPTLGPTDWLRPAPATIQPLDAVLRNAQELTGTLPNLIALDIPLNPLPITGRRTADDAISRTYGSRYASTHTPSVTRPGLIAVGLFDSLTAAGYVWQGKTEAAALQGVFTFIETYPHPAIIELLSLERRLPYKVTKRRVYFPTASPKERLQRVVANMDRLRDALAERLDGLAELVPSATALLAQGGTTALKNLEDVLDAAVCGVVGIEHLAGRTVGYGDAGSAIWVPAPAAAITGASR